MKYWILYPTAMNVKYAFFSKNKQTNNTRCEHLNLFYFIYLNKAINSSFLNVTHCTCVTGPQLRKRPAEGLKRLFEQLRL